MPQVAVTIAGRVYRMACGEGEEAHLEGLAASFDRKIDEMRQAFGEIGDMRLHVMAALTLSDEMLEMKKRLDGLQGELEALKAARLSDVERAQASERQIADALGLAAERIEHLARGLVQPPNTSSGTAHPPGGNHG